MSSTTQVARSSGQGEEKRWLLLTHHLPPDPSYLRVKVRRRLERIGAVPLKNSVYVLPETADTLEDFQWLFQEIEREGGEATLSEATFVDGVTSDRLVEQFRVAREADYAEVTASARSLLEEIAEAGSAMRGAASVGSRLERLVKRLREVSEVDFFWATGWAAAEHAVGRAKEMHMGEAEASVARPEPTLEVGTGRTWVTRQSVKVDRIASAWLIGRFIDPEARFAFVPARGFEPAEGDLRFDMFEGEFTHEGDACTFEVLLARFALDDPALTAIAELVHDVDCKDDKFGRPEAAGMGSMIDGLTRRHEDDRVRLARGGELFDGLYEHFSNPSG